MPSPFPGMDPYLEHRDYFPGLHADMITYLKEAIQPLLPTRYVAKTNERVWMEISDREVEPDLEVLVAADRLDESVSGGALTAVERTTRPVVITLQGENEELREPFLEIYTGEDSRTKLVTSVEVLSRSNKSFRSKGWLLYRKKQEEMLRSAVNLVEIDLLRSGEHVSSVPLRVLLKHVRDYDYHVCIHRFDRRAEFTVFPILLSQQLPSISIPLLPEDKPIEVNLQTIFDRCYETGGYVRLIDYPRQRPSPPLTPEQEAWAQSLFTKIESKQKPGPATS